MSDYFVHPSAVIDEGAEIGPGSRIWHFTHVSKGARLGRGCILGQNVYVGGKASMGNRVKVQNNVSIYDAVDIEDDVFLGPSCVLTNVINPRSFIERKHEYRPTHIGRGASIGANATIVCGHRIGAYAMIGAGAVVTKDVPDFALMVGVPATQLGWVCQCGQRLDEAMRCECGKNYIMKNDKCQEVGNEI